MSKRILTRIFIVLLLLCLHSQTFAVEEYVSDVYREIDSAFSNKSDEELNLVLQANQGDKYYFLMENYATKKVRRLIITNDYLFAMDTIIVIIDNNLENTDAVEMYALIAEAYEEEQKRIQEEEDRRIREEQRLVSMKEEQRASAEKKYNSVKSADGKTVFVTGKDGKLTYSGWNFNIGLNPASLINQSDDLGAVLAGVSLSGQYYKRINDYSFGIDLFANFQFLELTYSGKDSSMYAQFEVMPKIAFMNFAEKLFMKIGLSGVLPMKPKPDIENEIYAADTLDLFMSPAIGLALENIKFNQITLTAEADYLIGHLWTPDLKVAAGFKANAQFNVARTYLIQINFNMGVRDTIYVKNNGVENRLNVILALGVENVTN